MSFVRQRYGKANVRVLRVQREEDRHRVHESRVTVTLDGEFSRAYTDVDNMSVVATDTMKNLVNVLALQHLDAANESFALTVAQCFLDRYGHVAEARVRVDETVWDVCGSTAATTSTASCGRRVEPRSPAPRLPGRRARSKPASTTSPS